ncbi:MAG: ClpXP protease specificity-enhancing factor [Rhodocyclaceae bacterium]|nr:ClpXP protease specificity-enhancing factor [Rhodocyclaceae bacterium]MDZ4214127.1 ClpXP protease specificity-enhancing factor [Rhodocyclaceae bacterium]
MTSTKPYFIRAIHEWCSDEGFTPYLAVQVSARTRVPREFVSDGQIVLNVSLDATHQLQIGNEEISFQTRFNGASFPVLVPVVDVVAIYARENGQGMAFEAGDVGALGDEGKVGAGETAVAGDASDVSEPVDSATRKSSHLTRIK